MIRGLSRPAGIGLPRSKTAVPWSTLESKMAIRGSITLGELAARATTLDVACTRCERRARLRAATAGRNAWRRLLDDRFKRARSWLSATRRNGASGTLRRVFFRD
jgi:hypothetical protein